MFNECGMTSRQPFGSRLSVVLEEGSADAASSGSRPTGRFGKAFVAVRSPNGTDVLAQQGSPASVSSCCCCPLCLSGQSPKELWPQRDVLAQERIGPMPGPSLEHTATLSCSMAPCLRRLQHPENGKGHASLYHVMGSGVVT